MDTARAFWRPGAYILANANGVERRVSKEEFIHAWEQLHPQRPLPWRPRERSDLPGKAITEE